MPVSLFYSYAHEDEELKDRLIAYLAPLEWDGTISEGHDRKITAGSDFDEKINEHLMSANIILLLVSADFLASKYIWSVEITKALERHGRHEAPAVPVILKPCLFGRTPLARLQALPRDARPVTCWDNQDKGI